MNDVAWLPSLLVLGIGLAIGLAASAAVRRGRRAKAATQAGLELRLRDLEERRDDLYRRLRSPDLDEGDRESLELAAAHTLKELERLAPERARQKPPKPAAAAPAAPSAPAAAPAGGLRHPALVGFVAGMAVVLLVGWLVYLAVRDSGAATAVPQTTSGTTEAPHPEAEALPAEMQRELERLEAAAAAAPDDLLARKRLALARLDAGMFFDAFSDAEAILAGRPEDPDGLYIQGVVRLSMGQTEEAVELLDRVLVSFPDHLRAMVYRGLALAQGGDMEQAIATWEMALDMSGGSNPDIENLLRQARSQPPPAAAAAPPAAPDLAPGPAPQQAPRPAPQPAPPPAAAPATPVAPPPVAPPTAGPAYDVTVELAAGRSVPPGAVLFVFLRPGEAGPPVAVKRIPTPRFPLRLALGADDAMMAGAELPASGNLVARLSVGGTAVRGPDDLEAGSPASLGQPVRLILGGS